MSISIFDTGTANIASLEKSLDKIKVNYLVSKDIDVCIERSKKITPKAAFKNSYTIEYSEEFDKAACKYHDIHFFRDKKAETACTPITFFQS